MRLYHLNSFKNTLIILFVLFSILSFAQNNTDIYIGVNGKLTTQEKAIMINKKIIKTNKKTIIESYKKKDSVWEKYSKDKYIKRNDSILNIKFNSPEFTGTIIRNFRKISQNLYSYTDYRNGILLRRGTASEIIPLLLHGKTTEFYTNGNRKSESEYSNNELISNNNWRENGDKYFDNLFFSVDSDPEFKPGVNALNQYLIKGFKDADIDISAISGTLLIGFVVLENGTIDGIRILKGLGPNINNVAYQLFSNLYGEWVPAKLNDKTVRYYHLFPINFIYKQSQFEFAEMRGAILHWGAY